MDARIDITSLKGELTALPLISGDLAGTGGVIKLKPEHFRVEEILPYAACGTGEHLFITLTRKGWNTADVAGELARAFSVPTRDVGWGGRKDKHAVATQTFSIPYPLTASTESAADTLTHLPFEVLSCRRHGNKIRTGHVAGNRFDIMIAQVQADAARRADAIGQRIRRVGLPNFYGAQRFGHHMENLDRAMAHLNGRQRIRGRRATFYISALQSALFNIWLSDRIRRSQFQTVLAGDVVKKTDTGGMFVVEDLTDAETRFEARKITYTGPVFGHKMRRATAAAGEFEDHVLERFNLCLADFKPLRAPGSRRIAALFLDDLRIDTVQEGLRLKFTLPAGAYATTLLREFTSPR